MRVSKKEGKKEEKEKERVCVGVKERERERRRESERVRERCSFFHVKHCKALQRCPHVYTFPSPIAPQ